MNPLVCIPAAVQLLTYSSTYPVRTSLYLLLLTALCILDFSLRETAKPPSNEILSRLPCISLTSSTCLYNSRLLKERPFFTTSSRLSFLSANFLILFSGIFNCVMTYKSVETSLAQKPGLECF